VGLLVAERLGLPFTYSTPTRDPNATGLFPVSYTIPKPLERELARLRVAVVNDVINAGSAVRGTLVDLRRIGARPVAIGSLATFPSLIWEPAECPLCAKGVPLSP
jgi:orotate phosphoribosyltransferase